MRREHPFDTGTDCPTSPVIGELANLRIRTIEKGYVPVGPRRAALRTMALWAIAPAKGGLVGAPSNVAI
ncbi:MAG: hypothetical protein WAV38_23485 [Xanthobacteraceae bacterium]